MADVSISSVTASRSPADKAALQHVKLADFSSLLCSGMYLCQDEVYLFKVCLTQQACCRAPDSDSGNVLLSLAPFVLLLQEHVIQWNTMLQPAGETCHKGRSLDAFSYDSACSGAGGLADPASQELT